jgi:hypothetical protein
VFDDEESSLVATHSSDADVINFYFPVEVVIVGALRDSDRDALEARIWENLYDALERTV